jgi:hypothetical protein
MSHIQTQIKPAILDNNMIPKNTPGSMIIIFLPPPDNWVGRAGCKDVILVDVVLDVVAVG